MTPPLRDALAAALDGRYQLDPDVLGTGGMAIVFGARDLRHGRRVAIKLMRPEQALEFGADRFLREINLTANLQHPHILPLLDSGSIAVAGASLPYYVMPLVVGKSLRTRLDAEGAIPVDQAIVIVRDVAEGLDYAHQRGFIHRDIKPENILLNESGAALIADFGVARAIGPSSAGLTQHGAAVGTPAYMSPEQLFEGANLGAATDQFSLAAVTYELLAGQPPFRGNTRDDLVARRLTEPVASLRQLQPRIANQVEQVVLRGLASKAEDRFPSVRAFADALIESVTEPAETPAAAPTPVRATRRWRSIFAVGALIAAAAVAGWGWANRPVKAVRNGVMVMVADIDNLTSDSSLGRALGVATTVGLQQSSSFSVYPRRRLAQSLARTGRSIRDTTLTEALAREIAFREGAAAVVVMTVAEVGTQFTLATRILDPASGADLAAKRFSAASANQLLDATDRAVRWARRRLGDPNVRQAAPLPLVTTASLAALRYYSDAGAAFEHGRWAETQHLLELAVKEDTGFAMAQSLLGEFHVYANKIPLGLTWLREADRRAARLTEMERLEVKESLAQAEGRLDDRLALAKELATRFPSPGHWQAYGDALRFTGRVKESIAAYQAAVTLDSTNSSSLYGLAMGYRDDGDRRTALDLFAKIDRIDSTYLLTGFANQEWGETFLESGDVAGAEATFRRMLGRPNTADQARGYRALAYLATYRGRYGEAAQLLRQSIPRQPPGTLSEYRDQALLAEIELTRGDLASANAALDRVVEIFRRAEIQAPGVMFGGHQLIRAGRLAQSRLFLDSLRARAALRPASQQDQSALAILTADLRLAEGRHTEAALALAGGRFESYRVLGLSLRSELHAARGRYDSAAMVAKDASAERVFGLEVQQDWLRSFGQLARFAESAGDSATARGAYSQLIEMWREGDPDLPPLVTARRELARLQSATSR